MDQLFFTKSLRIGIFLLGIVLGGFYGVSSLYDGDTRQLLHHAQIFLETGRLVPYGSIASSGVKFHTPGSFLSIVVGIPMWLWNSPYAPLVLISGLHILALWLIMKTLNRVFQSYKIIILYLVFFWCNPWRTSEVFIWNPAYLYFFTALHFWSASQLFSENKYFWASCIHILSIMGALQCHSSFVILVILSVLLWWKKSLYLNKWGTGFGGLLGIISLIPYLIEKIGGELGAINEGMNTGDSFLFRGLIYVYPFLKGIWYWIRHGSFVFPSHLLTEVDFYWIKEPLVPFFKFLWMLIAISFATVTVVFSIKSHLDLYNQLSSKWNLIKFKKQELNHSIEVYIYLAFWAVLISSALIPADMSYWHILLIFPISILVPLIKLEKLWNQSHDASMIKKIIGSSLIYFIIFTLVTGMGSRKHRFPGNLKEMYLKEHVFQTIESRNQ